MPTWNHSENMGDNYKQNTGKSANQNLGFSLAQDSEKALLVSNS